MTDEQTGAVHLSPLVNSSDRSGPRAMSRLRAERVVAAAQRLSPRTLRRCTSYNSSDSTEASRAKTRSAASSLAQSVHDVYLQSSGVALLLEDVVKRLHEERPELPALFISSYFASAVQGTNVRSREFEYVNGSLQNRVAFLTQLQRGLSGVDMSMAITSDDFAELVWCHCSDVPQTLIYQASSHIHETAQGVVCASMQSFVTAFSACFVYNEFLNKVYDVYNDLSRASRNTAPSSPQDAVRSESIVSAMAADRVVARLRLIAQQPSVNSLTVPPLGDVESFVLKSSSFQEFCALFFLSPSIAATIRELQVAFATLSEF